MLGKFKVHLIGAFVGAILGFLYWYFMGKDGNTNPVDQSPILATIWGSLMGIAIAVLLKSANK